jgi:hypothetical protein
MCRENERRSLQPVRGRRQLLPAHRELQRRKRKEARVTSTSQRASAGISVGHVPRELHACGTQFPMTSAQASAAARWQDTQQCVA